MLLYGFTCPAKNPQITPVASMSRDTRPTRPPPTRPPGHGCPPPYIV
jgi:hypothetical protein